VTRRKAADGGLDIAIFGSSIVSSWWNGAATYYRGLVRSLAALGHHVTFHEPIAYDRQDHRDIADPEWCRVVVYRAETEDEVREAVAAAAESDVAIKTSGVGVHDALLEHLVADLGDSGVTTAFLDVDAPATLGRVETDPADAFRAQVGRYDLVMTYGGGQPVIDRYTALGARECVLVYNALDPTTHHRVAPDTRFAADLSLLANRLPDREERIDEFFFRAASLLPERTFLLGGNGWAGKSMPPNVRAIGHVGTEDHNAFNCSALSVLNVTRESMAANGWSPATRVFEAAGVGACLLTDAWDGIEDFLRPGDEVLVAHDGAEVAAQVRSLDPSSATRIGDAAERRVLAHHTYDQRARLVDTVLRERVGVKGRSA
jgi:spore maturation protein CgeB